MCEPDFSAYSMEMNHKPFSEDFTLRSAGGHIHIGYDDVEVPYDDELFGYTVDQQRSTIVRALDLFISVPMLLVEPDNKRKELYGKAGAFRPKSYGLEYRTPSNFYLTSKELCQGVFNSVTKAIDFINNNEIKDDLAKLVENTINNNDKPTAEKLVKDFNLSF